MKVPNILIVFLRNRDMRKKKQLETINYEKQIIRNVLNFSIYERFNSIKVMREFDEFRCEIYYAFRTAIVYTEDE